ncbi:MAG: hypothetical protein QGG71_15645 [Pirellulaceae bacterium]|nr:hypothetical protein [Pirellulaceae bacterium]
MLIRVIPWLLVAMIACSSVQAQQLPSQQLPSVEKLIADHDANGDGKLDANEVKGSTFARQFSRWDVDADGFVKAADIIKFRARFGIAADGSRIGATPVPRRVPAVRKSPTPPAAEMLPVPAVDDLKRADSGTRLTRSERKNSAYVLKTAPHLANGDRYVVLTDHNERAFLGPLHRLVKHYGGTLLKVESLATLHLDRSRAKALLVELQSTNPEFVAIAPRIESLRENMLLHVWELLAQIDEDPQLDAYPGILVASTANGLARLVDQSIDYRPRPKESLLPMAISQVPSRTELRSLQKAAILRRQFESLGLQTPIVAVYTARATGAPQLDGEPVWNLATTTSERFVKSFPDEIGGTLRSSNLVIMHGHGSPGMSCSLSLSAIPKDCGGKLLLTGSCFSASPQVSDLAELREAPGGYAITAEDAFVLRAIDSGAVSTFGHMRFSKGFPHLYPVLESWMRGETIGQSYQQLINGLIEKNHFDSRALVMEAATIEKKRPTQNVLLYVLIGDPALQPLVQLID